MGETGGELDESPPARATIKKAFWMGVYEVTNEQYRRFDPSYDSGYLTKFRPRRFSPGPLRNTPKQPVLRISWEQAMAFCSWLSRKTSLRFTLPTEAQWEYAGRAGSATPLSYGDPAADFSKWANVADLRVAKGAFIREAAVMSYPADRRFDDGHIVTAPVGEYRRNAWGLYDMHGNAAEWTLTTYRPYPYKADDGRNDTAPNGRKVVRGGSFLDRPKRCRSAFRLSYPAWQGVSDVGFRVAAPAGGRFPVASRCSETISARPPRRVSPAAW
jgi:formylglycine-generating enzyme required for sulfatase activity